MRDKCFSPPVPLTTEGLTSECPTSERPQASTFPEKERVFKQICFIVCF